jgi:hypothetical protein
MGQWINDLAAQRREVADGLAERQSLTILPKTSTTQTSARHSQPGQAPARTRSCNRPSPRFPPPLWILDCAVDRDLDMEAAN